MNTQLTGRVILFAALGVLLSGCVSKSKAQQQARMAYMAGRQETLARMPPPAAGPGVTFLGPVRMPTVPWTTDLTLAKGIVSAGYFGPEPTSVVIVRNGEETRIDPKALLSGADVPLESGDVVRIQ
jgi:hypothetical protein